MNKNIKVRANMEICKNYIQYKELYFIGLISKPLVYY